MKVPLAKIEINNEIKNAVSSVLKKGNFILGEETKKFEEEFARFCGVKYASAVSSGTAALYLSLLSLGIKKNDEVIVPSLSFIATVTPLLMLGAKPKFVDVNSQDYTIDVEQLEKKISKKTKAIIPVHLYGHPANMLKISKIAKDYSLLVVEDSAQAHGAKVMNRSIGGFGDAGCFSFYPSKNLTVCGDGGMVISKNKDVIQKIKMLRNHGREDKYLHKTLGYNLRFNEIQAAIGRIMLKKLKVGNSKRRKNAKQYSSKLDSSLIKPIEKKWATHVFHMYTIRTKNRDKLLKYLKSKNIGAGIHYPIPIHKQPMLKQYNRIKLPITEEVSKTTLSLPVYPTLSNSEQEYVIHNVNKFIVEEKR